MCGARSGAIDLKTMHRCLQLPPVGQRCLAPALHRRSTRPAVASAAAKKAEGASSERKPVRKSKSQPPAQQPDDEETALQKELEVQEREADVTVEDLLQMQYEVPADDAELKAEALDMLEGQESVFAEQSKAQQQQEEEEETGQTLSKKAQILLELIAAAAGPDIDTKIAQFESDIDEELLQMLQTRIESVSKVGAWAVHSHALIHSTPALHCTA